MLYLPPYSLDYSPIENGWSKLKARRRKTKARTREALDDALKQAIESVTATDAISWLSIVFISYINSKTAVGEWVYAVLANACDGPDAVTLPVRLRMMGATVPTHEIVTALAMPFVLVSVVNSDNNQLTFDENPKMNNYLTDMRSMLGLLMQLFP